MSRSQDMTAAEREKGIRQSGLRTASYAYESKGGQTPPDYARVIAQLSDTDVLAEIKARRGERGYQRALRKEAKRREIC